MRRIKIAAHLDIETLETRYRESADGITRSHWQIVWLLAKGQPSEAVAQVTGYSVKWIRLLAQRYNAEGETAVGDQRHHNRGAQGKLNRVQQQRLSAWLSEAAARGQPVSGRAVAEWMSKTLGQPVHVQRGYEQRKRLGFSAQWPRPAHRQASGVDQRLFKKTIRR
jgi:transposase